MLAVSVTDQPQGPVAVAAVRALLDGVKGAAQVGQLAWSGLVEHAARLRRGVAVLDADAAAEELCRDTVYAITGEAAPAALCCRPPSAVLLRPTRRPAI